MTRRAPSVLRFAAAIAFAAPTCVFAQSDSSLADWLAGGEGSEKQTASEEFLENPKAPAPLTEPSPFAKAAWSEPGQETELVKERYPDGTVKVEREVTLDPDHNYVNHGSWTMFDRNGGKIAQGQYEMGKKDGAWKRWYAGDEGKMFESNLYSGFERPFRAEVDLEYGRLHGSWIVYDAKGRKASRWEFVSGHRHGKSTWYHANGAPSREVSFNNGQIDGELIDWNQQREIARKVVFVAGRELVRDLQWHNDSQKRHEGWVLRSRFIEKPSYDWWAGNVNLPLAKGQADQRHGRWLFWHANGNQRAEGEYHVGNRNGGWVWWYSNGQIMAKGGYETGNPHGRWGWWYESGHRKSIGKYDQGDESGVWSSWEPNGHLVQILDYSAPVVAEAPTPDVQPEELVVIEKQPPVEEVPAPDLTALRAAINSGRLR